MSIVKEIDIFQLNFKLWLFKKLQLNWSFCVMNFTIIYFIIVWVKYIFLFSNSIKVIDINIVSIINQQYVKQKITCSMYYKESNNVMVINGTT